MGKEASPTPSLHFTLLPLLACGVGVIAVERLHPSLATGYLII